MLLLPKVTFVQSRSNSAIMASDSDSQGASNNNLQWNNLPTIILVEISLE